MITIERLKPAAFIYTEELVVNIYDITSRDYADYALVGYELDNKVEYCQIKTDENGNSYFVFKGDAFLIKNAVWLNKEE